MSTYCPDHGTELDNNRCPHGHDVKAADATNEPRKDLALSDDPSTDEPTCAAHLVATDGGPDLKCVREPGTHIHHRTADGATFERWPFGLARSSKPKQS